MATHRVSASLCWLVALLAAPASPLHASPLKALDRRRALGVIAAPIAAPLAAPRPARAAAGNRVVAADGAFAFVAPETFNAKPKPVKTHLDEVIYKDENRREIGVVVDRVKLDRLVDFGSPAFVGDKVVASERNRDGVTSATLRNARQVDVAGETYFELAYENESSRGNNQFLSRIAVRDGRLFIMTLKARVDDADAAAILGAVAASFQVPAS